MTTTVPSPRSRVYGIDFSGARDAGKKLWIAGGIAEGGRLRVERCASAAEWLGVGPDRDRCLAALSGFIAQREEVALDAGRSPGQNLGGRKRIAVEDISA